MGGERFTGKVTAWKQKALAAHIAQDAGQVMGLIGVGNYDGGHAPRG
jgi:hypothetical protein